MCCLFSEAWGAMALRRTAQGALSGSSSGHWLVGLCTASTLTAGHEQPDCEPTSGNLLMCSASRNTFAVRQSSIRNTSFLIVVCQWLKWGARGCNPSRSYGASPAMWDHTVLPSTRHTSTWLLGFPLPSWAASDVRYSAYCVAHPCGHGVVAGIVRIVDRPPT